jgi:hypothetical protein
VNQNLRPLLHKQPLNILPPGEIKLLNPRNKRVLDPPNQMAPQEPRSPPPEFTRVVPGRLLSAESFKLPHGYVLSLPVGAYYTWQGRLLEGSGVTPDVEVDLSYDALTQGVDTQLNAALDFLERSSLQT